MISLVAAHKRHMLRTTAVLPWIPSKPIYHALVKAILRQTEQADMERASGTIEGKAVHVA